MFIIQPFVLSYFVLHGSLLTVSVLLVNDPLKGCTEHNWRTLRTVLLKTYTYNSFIVIREDYNLKIIRLKTFQCWIYGKLVLWLIASYHCV